jgi:endonuclease III related protein
MSSIQKQTLLIDVYHRLEAGYGPQHWWPADEPFEIIVGAILTQSAAWTNVEKGIRALKAAGVLHPQGLRAIPGASLAGLIHACGYYNAKTVKLKAFAEWFGARYGDNLAAMFSRDTHDLREELLSVHGIGEETADSILLYAGNHPIFVIDAYTRRFAGRHGLNPRGGKYADFQKLFMDNLPEDARLFNEYHALLVALGKNHCRKNLPLCANCGLNDLPHKVF